MSVPNLAAKTCRSCVHSKSEIINGQTEVTCWRFPPHVTPIIVPNQEGGFTVVGKVSMAPKVEANWACGEHRRLAIVQPGDVGELTVVK